MATIQDLELPQEPGEVALQIPILVLVSQERLELTCVGAELFLHGLLLGLEHSFAYRAGAQLLPENFRFRAISGCRNSLTPALLLLIPKGRLQAFDFRL